MKLLFKKNAGALQLILVIAIVSSAVLLSTSMRPDAQEVRPRATTDSVAVSTLQPHADSYAPRVTLNGVVQARTVTSIIPQVDGRVTAVSPSFRPGAEVRRGELLFEVDPSDYELAIAQTAAEIELARSELAQLEAEAAAERKIWESRFPERQIPDLIVRKPQIAAAKARLHSGEAARSAAELALSRTQVRAPFDARVLETQLDVGQVISPAAAVGRMFSTASLEVSTPVSADELRQIGEVQGRDVTIVTPLGEKLPGTVVRRAAALDERTRLGTLFIASDDAKALTLGEFVSVEVEGAVIENALRLPPSALTSRDRVWVVAGERLEPREIDVLGRDGDMLVVRAFDIAAGVVTIPPSDVRAGMPVQATSSTRYAGSGGVSGVAE